MKISVIIPTYHEEATIAETVRNVSDQSPHEVIVVDGGSQDRTLDMASNATMALHGPRGRAAQMNHGASLASGESLLFLHADCQLERGALREAGRLMVRSSFIAGCFRMCVTEKGMLYRMIDGAATARSQLTGMIYGDQGMFLRREIFERVGGFPSYRFMEDVGISLRLRKLGRVKVARSKILVSPRRWQRQGVLRQSFRNWTLTTLAAFGVHPDRLAKFYPNVR